MEKIDKDVSTWVLEFLLRNSAPNSLIQKTLAVLPLSGLDNRLNKTLLLHTLEFHLMKASLSESTLEIIERLAELDRTESVPISDAMRRAYCAIAVDSTVKYLAASPDDPSAEYFSAVRRIWRGRVVHGSAEGGRSELVSDELFRWRDDVEAALLDCAVSERLADLNTRRDAMNEVKVYLKEAWGVMGPAFLDSVAVMNKAKRPCLEGVCEIASVSEMLKKCDGGLEGLGKEKIDSVGGDRNDDGACSMEAVAVAGENHGKKQVDERVGSSVDGNRKGCLYDSEQEDKAIQKSNHKLRRKQSALRTRHRGVKISGAEEVIPIQQWSKYEPPSSTEVNEVRESLRSSSAELQALVKDPLPDALHTSEVVRSKLATNDINLGRPIENQGGDEDVADANVCMDMVPYRPRDVNLGKKSSVQCSNVNQPSIMEQRSSAHTYEWDDSIDNFSQGRPPRRKKRKWTSLEEETLRAGVKTFGEGNWSSIRNFYSNIFEYRSGVDLKDKWRNMIR